MSENRVSEGVLVTYEHATAASNIVAGTPVCYSSAGSTLIYTLATDTTSQSATNSLAVRFIGILDEDVSAGDSPITVWTEGVFRMITDSDSETAHGYIGAPVWSEDGNTYACHLGLGSTGAPPIGTLVSVPSAAVTRVYVDVRINPGAYRWTIFVSGIGPAVSATQPIALGFPKLAG